MSTKQLFTVVTVATCILLGATAQYAAAQPDEPFRARDFDYGSRFALPDGQQPGIMWVSLSTWAIILSNAST